MYWPAATKTSWAPRCTYSAAAAEGPGVEPSIAT